MIFLPVIVLEMTITGLIYGAVVLSPSSPATAENSSLTLACTYTGQETVTTFSFKVVRKEDTTFSNVGIINAECKPFILPVNNSIYEYACLTKKQYTWTIKKVTRLNAGERYQCVVDTPSVGVINSNNVIISVQVAITSIVLITPSSSIITVKESTETEFKCKTSGGLPKATITWYKSGGTPSHSGNEVAVDSKITTSSVTIDGLEVITSTLIYSPSRTENGWRIFCKASNIVGQTPVTSTRKPLMDVQYPPGLPIITNLMNGGEYKVMENTVGNLSCSITGGNPAPTLSWDCYNRGTSVAASAGTVSKGQTWTAERGKDKVCICRSSHYSGTKSVSINIVILYPPERPIIRFNGKIIPGSIQFIEGKTRSVECESHGKPNPDIYTWSRGSQAIRIGRTLTFNSIKRHNDSQYTCTAENTMIPSNGPQQTGRNSSAVTVSVLFPPTNILLYYGGTNGELITGNSKDVVKNETFKIQCKSDGQPPPMYTWSGQSLNQSLLITSINVNTNKTCTATNTMRETYGETKLGSSSASLLLNVVYKATIRSFVLEGVAEIEESSFTVNEKDKIQIVCTVESKPSSSIELAFQNKIIYEQNKTNSLQYTHQPTSCLDAGIYTCSARNKYNSGNDARAKLKLHVQCSPRPLRQMKVNFTSSLNDTVTLTFTTLAIPEPGINGFDWYKQNSFTWIPLLGNTDLLITSSGLQTSLTIKRVYTSDFGHYRVTVKNDIGKYDQYLYLVEKEEQSSTEVLRDFDNTGQQSKITGLIVCVAILGVLFTAVTLYAIIMTIYFKRKLILKETHVSPSAKQTTYTNLSYRTEDQTDAAYSRPSGNNTAAAIDQDYSDSLQQYTDLVHYSNVEQKTYDVIQKN